MPIFVYPPIGVRRFVQDSLSDNFEVTATVVDTPGGGMAQVSSVEVTVSIPYEQTTIISCVSSATVNGPGGNNPEDIIVGYQINSETPVVCGKSLGTEETSGNNVVMNISFSEPVILIPGLHTIKYMAASSTTTDPTVIKNANIEACRFSVMYNAQ